METVSLLHGLLGYMVFFSGLLQFILKKGGRMHRRIGYLYVIAWFFLLISGAIIGHVMITFLGIFGFYNVITAVRFAQIKSTPKQLIDKVIAVTGIIGGTAILYSAIQLILKDNLSFALVFLVFGSLFFISSFKDFKTVIASKASNEKYGKMTWYFEHFTRMGISFIAALTAFSAIQNISGIVIVNWLLPTILGTLYLIVLTRKYKQKFKLD